MVRHRTALAAARLSRGARAVVLQRGWRSNRHVSKGGLDGDRGLHARSGYFGCTAEQVATFPPLDIGSGPDYCPAHVRAPPELSIRTPSALYAALVGESRAPGRQVTRRCRTRGARAAT